MQTHGKRQKNAAYPQGINGGTAQSAHKIFSQTGKWLPSLFVVGQTEDIVRRRIDNPTQIRKGFKGRKFIQPHILTDRRLTYAESSGDLCLRQIARADRLPQPFLNFLVGYHIKKIAQCALGVDK